MSKILFVAPNVPVADTNAGDYRIMQMLRILSSHHRVYFCPLYSEDISLKEKKILDKISLQVIKFSELKKMKIQKEFKVTFFEFYWTLNHYFKEIRTLPDSRIIIDSHSIRHIENYRNDLIERKEYRRQRDKEIEAYKRADTVLAVSDREAQLIRKESKTEAVKLITGIRIPDYVRGRRGRKDIIFIGCMKNMHNQSGVKHFIHNIFPIIKSRSPEMRFIIAGSYPPSDIRAFGNGNVKVTGYVPDVEVYASSCLVSVVPLLAGAGIKNKIIQSMAYGAPVVSTSIGAEGMGLINRKNILIENCPEKFARAVLRLYRERSLWKKISGNGFIKVKKEFSLKKMEKELLEIV